MPVMDSPPRARVLLGHGLMVLLVCAAVYWPGLGRWGLHDTEGHRAIPAWEMMDSPGANPLVPRLFGRIYLRKPQGMTWAVAASSSIFGQSEFAARAVSAASATLAALLAWVMAWRWFGWRSGIWGGLAQALTPWFWPPGRSAEIESLNNVLTMAGVLLLIDALVVRPRRWRGVAIGVAAGVAFAGAGLAKGPASLPCLVAVVAAACVVGRSVGPIRSPALWSALGVAGAALGVIGVLTWRTMAGSGESAALQSPGAFLWSSDRVLGIVTLAPVACASALPMSLALLFVWWRGERREGGVEAGRMGMADLVARTIAWTCVLSLALMTLAGVGNPRYAMPAFSFVSPLVAYVARGWAGAFTIRRQALARALALGSPVVWPVVVLLVAAGAYIMILEPRRGRTSGRDAGRALAAALPDGAIVWADDLIEARPETLWYAQREALRDGRVIRFSWVEQGASLRLPEPGGYVILRDDAGSDESDAARSQGLMDRLEAVERGSVHTYRFVVYRVVR